MVPDPALGITVSQFIPAMSVDVIHISTGDVVRDFYRPRCLKCAWHGEVVSTDAAAKMDAAAHNRINCLADAGSEVGS